MSRLIDAMRTPNPHHVGAPARMADGRLFTDYGANCKLLPIKKTAGPFAEFELHQRIQAAGQSQRRNDQMTTVLRAANTICVDTMVPELSKRVYAWNGGEALMAHSVGIGSGRMYLPGRPDLVTADPDVVAVATIPDAMLPGTFSTSPTSYVASGIPAEKRATAQLPATYNRYAAPYGN
jgi:hypothetical protein